MGAYALVYASMYPAQVAGMALIDSSSPEQFELRRVGALLPSLSRVGGRLVDASSAAEYSADRIEFNELPRVLRQAKALRSLHGKPLAVVTADRGAMRGWQAAQAKLVGLSTDSFQVHIPGATHATILVDDSYARIAGEAIVDVTERVGT